MYMHMMAARMIVPPGAPEMILPAPIRSLCRICHFQNSLTRLCLRGLHPAAVYRASALDGQLAGNCPAEASGAYWMQHGMDADLREISWPPHSRSIA
jgi:hypothetical protein